MNGADLAFASLAGLILAGAAICWGLIGTRGLARWVRYRVRLRSLRRDLARFEAGGLAHDERGRR